MKTYCQYHFGKMRAHTNDLCSLDQHTKSVSAVRYTFVVVFLFVFLDGVFLASCNMNEQKRHLLHLTGTIGPLLFNLLNSKHPDWTNYCGWLAVCTQSLLINNWTNYCIQWVKRLKGYLCIIMATYDANSDINEDSQPFDVSSCWNQKCREGRSKEEGNVNGEGKKARLTPPVTIITTHTHTHKIFNAFLMNWFFIANLKLIRCVMNPLVSQCAKADSCYGMCAWACVKLRLFRWSVYVPVVMVCVLIWPRLCLRVAHRWLGYADWAQRVWLSYMPYQPIASLLTIRY